LELSLPQQPNIPTMKNFALLLTIALSTLFCKSMKAQDNAQPASARLNHIAVYVSSLEKSGKFYQDMLSLVKIEEPFKDGKHIWFTLGPAGQLHLISGLKGKVAFDKNEHLCFSVPSIDKFIARLNDSKIEYTNWPGTEKAPTVRVDGVKQVYFQDPDGHWLEVNDDNSK
jgi:lactoylglutathione lyase